MAGSFRDGKVHVLSEMCATCVFRPGNLMHLAPGRVAGMVREAKSQETAIICHSTLYRDDMDEAVCRGFYDKHSTSVLQIAQRLGCLAEIAPPEDSCDGSQSEVG